MSGPGAVHHTKLSTVWGAPRGEGKIYPLLQLETVGRWFVVDYCVIMHFARPEGVLAGGMEEIKLMRITLSDKPPTPKSEIANPQNPWVGPRWGVGKGCSPNESGAARSIVSRATQVGRCRSARRCNTARTACGERRRIRCQM